ncbi:hypothetical protein [Microbacterium sp. 179-I 3D4 NHS]|uniref:hypothetical protein n=1 Tax=Microbacterium sp. 179-I 3D4 NHS TaxID=3142381 RepID=UPI0039A149AD
MLKKLAAISLAAGVILLAGPTAATADPGPYADKPKVTVDDPIIDICDVSTIVFGAGSFLSGEQVGVSVSGINAADAAVSGNTAAADGSLTVTFRPPDGGSGSYAVTFTSGGVATTAQAAAAAGIGQYTAVITVNDASSGCMRDPAVAAAGTELPLTGSPMELALTGGDVSPWLIGGGAAALAVGGGILVVATTRRKRA